MLKNNPEVVVVIVEDDNAQREEVVLALQLAGMTAFGAPDSRTLDHLMGVHPVDVVVLDIGLPGETGLEIAARLAAQPVPVGLIMLTALGGLNDRLSGMARGADAYLTKPADPRELIATIKAVRRRMVSANASAAVNSAAQLLKAGWQLSQNGRQLSFGRQTQSVELSTLQREFLQCFNGAAVDEPLSRDGLMMALGHSRFEADHHKLETLVSRLRRKIREELGQEFPIQAVPGRGYALTHVVQFDSAPNLPPNAAVCAV